MRVQHCWSLAPWQLVVDCFCFGVMAAQLRWDSMSYMSHHCSE